MCKIVKSCKVSFGKVANDKQYTVYTRRTIWFDTHTHTHTKKNKVQNFKKVSAFLLIILFRLKFIRTILVIMCSAIWWSSAMWWWWWLSQWWCWWFSLLLLLPLFMVHGSLRHHTVNHSIKNHFTSMKNTNSNSAFRSSYICIRSYIYSSVILCIPFCQCFRLNAFNITLNHGFVEEKKMVNQENRNYMSVFGVNRMREPTS